MLSNGSPLLTKVTGAGCLLGELLRDSYSEIQNQI